MVIAQGRVDHANLDLCRKCEGHPIGRGRSNHSGKPEFVRGRDAAPLCVHEHAQMVTRLGSRAPANLDKDAASRYVERACSERPA